MEWLTPARRAMAESLLADLVRIPSVNQDPAQADLTRAEAQIIAFVQAELETLGMELELHPVRAGRANLIGRWPADGLPVTLEAHVDTVGVDEMTIPPFEPELRDGRMYGRGVCDTKGSLAAFLSALRIAREEGWRFDRPVQLVAAMGEETGCEGAIALARAGYELGWTLVGEPTSCEVVTAHKGCLWLTVTCHGRSTHASVPDSGDNAIYRMGRVLRYIEDEWLPALGERTHPLLGSETGSVGVIVGGEKVNVVPARCRLELDHRVLPSTRIDEATARFEEGLRRALGPEAEQVTVEAEPELYPGFSTPAEAPLAQAMVEAVRRAGGRGEPVGVSYFSDAGPLAAAGASCVVFGPGDIRQAHGPDEWLTLAELHRATETVLRFLGGFRST